METEEERRVRRENDAATKRLSLAMETNEARKKGMDLIWIEVGLRLEASKNISRNELAHPVMGAILLV